MTHPEPLQFPGDDTQARAAQLDQVVEHWLAAKHGHSGSERTRRAYADTLASLRAHLRALGRELDSPAGVILAQVPAWAALGVPAPATYNQRIAIVSSFYRHCDRHDLLPDHCPPDLARVDRRRVERYAEAQPIAPAEARTALAAIDRDTPVGLRDYALLLLALTTGRRVAEVAALRWSHCRVSRGIITITTPRAKGGKRMIDQLSPATAKSLLAWLHHHHGRELARLPAETAIWPSLSSNGTGNRPLGVTALKRICETRLGCNFHALRHTFARSMEDAGAKVSDIQARLGHESLDTTGRYLAALRRAENPHAQALDELFT